MQAGNATQGLVLRVTAMNLMSNVKLLTTAAMVDNLAKKVDECPLNRYFSRTIGTAKAVRYTE